MNTTKKLLLTAAFCSLAGTTRPNFFADYIAGAKAYTKPVADYVTTPLGFATTAATITTLYCGYKALKSAEVAVAANKKSADLLLKSVSSVDYSNTSGTEKLGFRQKAMMYLIIEQLQTNQAKSFGWATLGTGTTAGILVKMSYDAYLQP